MPETELFGSQLGAIITRFSMTPGEETARRRRKAKQLEAQKYKRPPKEKKERFNPFRQPIADEDETDFRHMHWAKTRADVRRHLAATGTSTHALDRFDNCGAECLVEWSDTANRYRLRASYCRCRHCQPCMKAKGNLIAINLKQKLEAGAQRDGDRFRFITLTLRHTNKPLRDQIAGLYAHFRKLRNSKLWKLTQRGGAVMLEVKLNNRNEWHPHLHIISEGLHVNQARLANHWMEITDGSFKVDVRAINTSKDAAFYVAKYVSKGTNAEVWDNDDRAQEWITATKGLRTCNTFGTWRSYRLTARSETETFTDWKPVGLLTRITAQARAGSVHDLNLLMILADALQFDPHKQRQAKKASSA